MQAEFLNQLVGFPRPRQTDACPSLPGEKAYNHNHGNSQNVTKLNCRKCINILGETLDQKYQKICQYPSNLKATLKGGDQEVFVSVIKMFRDHPTTK